MSTQLCRGTPPHLGLGLKVGCSVGSWTSRGGLVKGVCREWPSPGHGGQVESRDLSSWGACPAGTQCLELPWVKVLLKGCERADAQAYSHVVLSWPELAWCLLVSLCSSSGPPAFCELQVSSNAPILSTPEAPGPAMHASR